MFFAPKRHAYHDFPPTLAEEYLRNINVWDISKSWNRRQVYYTLDHGMTVIHDAIKWGSDGVILEFCKLLGDTKNSGGHIPRRMPSPLTAVIQAQKNFETICDVVKINGSDKSAKNWISSHDSEMCGFVKVERFFSTHAAVMHPDSRLVSAMLNVGLNFDNEELYVALLYSQPDIFELLLKRSPKVLDWMTAIRLILQVYKQTVYFERNVKMNLEHNLSTLCLKQPASDFHKSYLAQKIKEFDIEPSFLKFFKDNGFN